MRNRLITTLTATAACAASLVTATGASAATASSHGSTRLVGDCRHATYEPRSVMIACGDGGTFLKDVKYRSWNDAKATGTAQLWVNTDDPDAAAGNYAVSSVHFTMDRPKTEHGHKRFSRIDAPYVRHGKTHHEYLYPPVTAVG